MDLLYGTLTFVLVALFYLHVVGQYTTGNDLEMYESDYIDPTTLQETCNVMQPVIFEWKVKVPSPIKFMETSKFVMQVKDTRDYFDKPPTQNPESVSLLCASVVQLMRKHVQHAHYFSESNGSFMEDSGFLKNPKYVELDRVLKPPYTVTSSYDLLTGSQGVGLPLRYHTQTRKFLYVTSGKIAVKMTTWKNREWLDVTKDFENYDFRSPYNLWAGEHEVEDTLQFLNFEVIQGSVLYVPAFWFYTIQYLETDTVIIEYNYSTFVNKMAFALDAGQYYLQQQNITKKATKCIYTNISQLNHVNSETDSTPKTNDVKNIVEASPLTTISMETNDPVIAPIPMSPDENTYSIIIPTHV